MFKVLGSGLALAVGAGALYYWWTHEREDHRNHGYALPDSSMEDGWR